MAFIRLLILSLVVSTVVYVCVAWFIRSTRRERLEKEWDAANPGGDPAQRKAHADAGVDALTQSLGYRALWLIYILPIVIIGYTLLVTNWN